MEEARKMGLSWFHLKLSFMWRKEKKEQKKGSDFHSGSDQAEDGISPTSTKVQEMFQHGVISQGRSLDELLKS